jgi:sterol desaturase/sphingolipid hydroxylase (fatty acid hydroxylase superfamily)
MGAGAILREYLNLVGTVFLLTLVFYPFELLAPAERHQPISSRIFNLAYTPLLLAFAILIMHPLLNRMAGQALLLAGDGILAGAIRPRSGFVAQLLFAIWFALVWDIWQYWLHRFQHRVPFLWQTHRFHHGETAMNSTTQTRHHFLSHLLYGISYLPVLVLMGSQTPHYIAVFVMFRLWGFVNHMNVRLNIGPLTPFISGPQWHRIHHSIHTEHLNKNFATFFPAIDMLFGTYYQPGKNEYPPSGLPAGQDTGALSEATIAPFLGWQQSIMRRIRRVRSGLQRGTPTPPGTLGAD